MIVLLDLNFTLVANSEHYREPFARRIRDERYRHWLVTAIRPHHVILITARPIRHRSVTLARILAQTGWAPNEDYFNPGPLPPPRAKERALIERIIPQHGPPAPTWLAIESNPRTAAMYARHGILSLRADSEKDEIVRRLGHGNG